MGAVTRDRNKVMGILTGIAIILVVMGHLDMNELSVFGLFPYYSFHVMIFMFVSGYFYDPVNEENVFGYIGRKALRLLLPYYICAVFYGIISTVLSVNGFTFCSKMTVFNFFIEPFLGGHQYGLNFPSWFVPALFLTEVVNILGRRFLTFCRITDEAFSKIRLSRDIFILAATLIVGTATVMLAQGGHVWGYYKTPGRILLMLPVYEAGRVYRIHIEEFEKKIPDAACIAIVCALQFIAYAAADGMLNFSCVWCSSFASYPFMPYITSALGIWFWLRISRIIESSSLGSGLDKIGQNSFHIMMHHIAVFFLINLIMYGIGRHLNMSVPFDTEAFHTDINYVYLPAGLYVWKCLYLIAGILVFYIFVNIPLRFRR